MHSVLVIVQAFLMSAQLVLTLLVTSCERERSFNQLKLIKSCHTSRLTSGSLSGLALMKTDQDIRKRLHSSMKELRM